MQSFNVSAGDGLQLEHKNSLVFSKLLVDWLDDSFLKEVEPKTQQINMFQLQW